MTDFGSLIRSKEMNNIIMCDFVLPVWVTAGLKPTVKTGVSVRKPSAGATIFNEDFHFFYPDRSTCMHTLIMIIDYCMSIDTGFKACSQNLTS